MGTVDRKKGLTGLVLMMAVAAWVMLLGMHAQAEPTKAGWYTEGKKTYYYVSANSGLIRAVGLRQINGRYFYFKSDGTLQTGWMLTADGYRYFRPTGGEGLLGRMVTGLKRINGKRYHFASNGVMSTGYTQLKQGTYYFRRKGAAGVIGSAHTWMRCDGAKRYFGSKGKMVTSAWVGDYYVGADGARLKSAITPDGYLLGKDGKKVSKIKSSGWVKAGGKYYYYSAKKKSLVRNKFKTIDGATYYLDENGARVKGWKNIGSYRYYFNSKGVRQSGAVTIGGKQYYFNAKGRLQISKTVDGYTTDENGVIIKEGKTSSSKAKVLIVAGHGQGDVGATSSLGQEYLYTRKFARLIYKKLVAGGKVDVTYYMNGSTSYDLYQRNKAALGSLTAGITGGGSASSRVKAALKASSAAANVWEYDYVLEVHFNATAAASKDEKGNGVRKGFGIYVNSGKSAKQRKLDSRIVANMRGIGSTIWGGGVVSSSTLLNARICNELGVNYSLIETAFIDDRDDMKFYKSKKSSMADAVAKAIESYF